MENYSCVHTFFNNLLVNGTPYYFGVTAYTFSGRTGAKPAQLESAPRLLTIVPQWLQGIRYVNVTGDTLKNILHEGPSSGDVLPVVVNPTALPRSGASYKVVFGGSSPNQVWHLIRTVGTKTDTVAKNQKDQTGSDDRAVIIDGIDWRVHSSPLDFKNFFTVSNASGPIAPFQQGAFAFNASGFPLTPEGADRPDGTKQQSAGKLTASKGWGIHTGMYAPDMSSSYDNFRNRVTNAGVRWPQIIPYDFEIRFTAAGGKALIAGALTGKTDKLIDVPFELWNIGIGTPDNTADDYRMFPNILDVDGNYTFNLLAKAGTDSVDIGGGGSTHSISGGANDPFTDWIYWVAPVNKTPGQAGYNAIVADVQAKVASGRDPYLDAATTGGTDVIRRIVIVGWNMGDVATGPGSYAMTMPEPGTTFRIVTSKPNTASDVFTITVPPADQSSQLAKVDAEKVNVYPNPFIDTHLSETLHRSVTFTHLPARAVLRIYTLAGTLVRSFVKDDVSPFLRWDLMNEHGRLVAPGMYIVYVEMPEVGIVKQLKLCVIARE